MPPEAAPPRVMPPAKRGKRHPAKRARLLTGALSACAALTITGALATLNTADPTSAANAVATTARRSSDTFANHRNSRRLDRIGT